VRELKERPESYYVPFKEKLRDIGNKIRESTSDSTVQSSFHQLDEIDSNAHLYAPPVVAGASVEWSGDPKAGPSRVSLDGTPLPESPKKDKRATNKETAAKKQKKPKRKGGINVKDGSIVYVKAETWSKYKKKWPYPQHIELQYAYFKGSIRAFVDS
jgi:hypothetical protein